MQGAWRMRRSLSTGAPGDSHPQRSLRQVQFTPGAGDPELLRAKVLPNTGFFTGRCFLSQGHPEGSTPPSPARTPARKPLQGIGNKSHTEEIVAEQNNTAFEEKAGSAKLETGLSDELQARDRAADVGACGELGARHGVGDGEVKVRDARDVAVEGSQAAARQAHGGSRALGRDAGPVMAPGAPAAAASAPSAGPSLEDAAEPQLQLLLCDEQLPPDELSGSREAAILRSILLFLQSKKEMETEEIKDQKENEAEGGEGRAAADAAEELLQQQVVALRAQLRARAQQAAALHDAPVGELRPQAGRLVQREAQLEGRVEKLQRRVMQLEGRVVELKNECDAAISRCGAAMSERAKAATARDAAVSERDAALGARGAAESERGQAVAARARAVWERDVAVAAAVLLLQLLLLCGLVGHA